MNLYLRHRPNQLSEMFGNENAIASLKSLLQKKKNFPSAVLIYGPTGCGKTTLARIIKKELGCSDEDFTELNTANTRGIDTVREIIENSNYSTFSGGVKIYLIDECFSANTKVLIDYGKALRISDIVRNPNITEVLSYDLENKRIEKRKIVRCIRRRFNGNRVKIIIKLDNKNYSISSTESHKFYVLGIGYVPAKDLKVGYKLIKLSGDVEFSYSCRYCSELFLTQKLLNGHILKNHKPFKSEYHRSGSCKYCGKTFSYLRAHEVRQHEITCEQREKIFKKISLAVKGSKGPIRIEAAKKALKTKILRYGKKGLMDIARRAGRKRWDSLSEEKKQEQIKRFINAPKYKSIPNQVEKKIISWKVQNLHFVGGGTLFIKLPDGIGGFITKNPDFIVKEGEVPGSKVLKYVEVMDFEYWHKEDWQKIETYYKFGGKELLIIDAKRVQREPGAVRAELEAFIRNSYVTITSVKILNYQNNIQHEGWVYNLEIEGTHNYFVCAEGIKEVPFKRYSKGYYSRKGSWVDSNSISMIKRIKLKNSLLPILVSNCHKLTNDAQNALLKVLEDTPPKVHFILCTTDPEKVILTVRNRCSMFKVNMLPSFILSRLIEGVCKAEGKTINKDVVKEIVRVSKGSPRQALVLLEKELDVDPKGALQELEDLDISETKTKDIIYLLLKPKSADKWEQMSKLIKGLEQLEPEAFRVGILNYFSKVLLGEEKVDEGRIGLYAGRISLMMECFSQPFLYGGYGLLVNALFKASSI